MLTKKRKRTIVALFSNKPGLIVMLLLGFSLAMVLNSFLDKRNQNVKVWAVDETVSIPRGLERYLIAESKDGCKDYKGTNGPDGVSLFAVVRSVNNKYARMVYGCSDDLRYDTQIVAAKNDGKWKLISPVPYYGNGNTYPACSQLEKYNISKAAEPICQDDKGETQKNTIE